MRAEGATAEREQVLILLMDRIEGKKVEKLGESERDSVLRTIESLRSNQPEQP